MTPITVTLPWPSSKLSLNARGHWAVKAAAVKKARSDAYYAAIALRPRWQTWPSAIRIKASAEFTPPVMRRHDQTNLVGRMKAYEDGIAQAIGIDDSRWTWAAPVVTAPRRPGCVTVTIEPVEAA